MSTRKPVRPVIPIKDADGEPVHIFWPADKPGDPKPPFAVTTTPTALQIAREHGCELLRPWPIAQEWVTEDIGGTPMTGWRFTYATMRRPDAKEVG